MWQPGLPGQLGPQHPARRLSQAPPPWVLPLSPASQPCGGSAPGPCSISPRFSAACGPGPALPPVRLEPQPGLTEGRAQTGASVDGGGPGAGATAGLRFPGGEDGSGEDGPSRGSERCAHGVPVTAPSWHTSHERGRQGETERERPGHGQGPWSLLGGASALCDRSRAVAAAPRPARPAAFPETGPALVGHEGQQRPGCGGDAPAQGAVCSDGRGQPGAFLQEAGLEQGKGSGGFSRVVTGRRGRVGHRQDIPGEGTVWQEDVLGPPGLACWRPRPRGRDAGWQAACTWAHVFHTGAGSKRPRWFLELVRPPRESRALRSSLGGHTGGIAGSQDTLRASASPDTGSTAAGRMVTSHRVCAVARGVTAVFREPACVASAVHPETPWAQAGRVARQGAGGWGWVLLRAAG